MKYIANECVDCPKELGCLGASCPNKEVVHYKCDKCNDELSPQELYILDNQELCVDCLVKSLTTVAERR